MVTNLLHLIQNLLLILGFVFLFGLTLKYIFALPKLTQHFTIGLAFGGFGVLNFILAVTVTTGVINDIRSPLILIATLFGGWQAGFISTGVIAAYRYFVVGGAGAFPGSISIFAVFLLALAYRHYINPEKHYSLWYLALLGYASVWVSVATATLFLPQAVNQLFLADFIPTASLIYPTATTTIGFLLYRERKRSLMVDELRLSEARFKAIFNQTFQFIGLLEPSGKLLEANQTALAFAGLQAVDVVGKNFWDISWWRLSAETQERLKNAIAKAAKGEFVRYREEVVGQGNQIIMIDFSLKPIFDSNNQVVMLIPEGRDVTSELIIERQKADLMIERERIRIIQNFIYDAGHHFRTPLAVMTSSLHLCKQWLEKMQHVEQQMILNLEDNQPDLAVKDVDELQSILISLNKRIPKFTHSIKTLSELVDNLAELVQLDSVQLHNFTVQDISQLIQYSIQMAEEKARETNLQFHKQVTTEVVYVSTDERLFIILLNNLLDNAIQYNTEDGTITVSLHQENEQAIIRIQDTGIGIAEQDLDSIFERFYRADNAQKHRPNGSGLGLALVKQIVNLHLGTITVESTLNVGTTVTLRLPVQSAPPSYLR